MLYSVFKLFLAYSAPRFQKTHPVVSLSKVQDCASVLTRSGKMQQMGLGDLNNGQLARLLEHCNLPDIQPYVSKYNLTGKTWNIQIDIDRAFK